MTGSLIGLTATRAPRRQRVLEVEQGGWFALTVIVWIPLALLFDARGGLGEQWTIGIVTWMLLLAALRGESLAIRAQVVAMIVLATVVEYSAAPWLGFYSYRLDNVPAFVPPGHGLVYLASLAMGRLIAQLSLRWRRLIFLLPWGLGSAWALWGLGSQGDVLGAVLFVFLLVFLLFGRSPSLYVAAFLLTTYLELLGTALGNWSWAPRDPLNVLSIGNPPSGIAGGIACWMRSPWRSDRACSTSSSESTFGCAALGLPGFAASPSLNLGARISRQGPRSAVSLEPMLTCLRASLCSRRPQTLNPSLSLRATANHYIARYVAWQATQ